MYKGQIPWHKVTGQPMYYPTDHYNWEYRGTVYDSWFEVERKFGKNAIKDAKRITLGPDWVDNKPFRARLKLVNYSRGRSAANFDFEGETGIKYTVFLKDMLDILQKCGIVQGWTEELTWCFCKRGQNYGLCLYEELSE